MIAGKIFLSCIVVYFSLWLVGNLFSEEIDNSEKANMVFGILFALDLIIGFVSAIFAIWSLY